MPSCIRYFCCIARVRSDCVCAFLFCVVETILDHGRVCAGMAAGASRMTVDCHPAQTTFPSFTGRWRQVFPIVVDGKKNIRSSRHPQALYSGLTQTRALVAGVVRMGGWVSLRCWSGPSRRSTVRGRAIPPRCRPGRKFAHSRRGVDDAEEETGGSVLDLDLAPRRLHRYMTRNRQSLSAEVSGAPPLVFSEAVGKRDHRSKWPNHDAENGPSAWSRARSSDS